MTEAGETLERLYREQGARLWRSLFAFSGDPEVASDALAEAFAQALARGNAIVRPDGWIWTAAFRIASGQLKERRRRPPRSAERASYEMPAEVIDLVAALAQLPNQSASDGARGPGDSYAHPVIVAAAGPVPRIARPPEPGRLQGGQF